MGRHDAQGYPGGGVLFFDKDIAGITEQLAGLLRQRHELSNGALVAQFEDEFASHHGHQLATATSSGTGALEAIFQALGVAGGEVIMPALGFAGVAFAALRAGARPIFADVLPDLSLNPADAARRLTSHTRAIVTVHIGGTISYGTVDLVGLSRDRRVPLVEDASQAHGSTLHGRTAGTFGVAAAFSFAPDEVIITGQGGMILTSSEELHETVRLLRDHGRYPNTDYHEVVGSNWLMTEPQAMLGLAQLPRLSESLQRRRSVADRYRRRLAGTPGAEVLAAAEQALPNYSRLIVLLEPAWPERLVTRLRQRHAIHLGGPLFGVLLHQQPALAHLGTGRLPVAEELARRHVRLPLHPSLTDEQVDHVADAFQMQLADLRLEAGRG